MKQEFRTLSQIPGTYRHPLAGDVFCYQCAGSYMYGRVIKTSINLGSLKMVLTYHYRPRYQSLTDIPSLVLGDFIIDPQLLWDECWNYGVFKKLYNNKLVAADVYSNHYFRDIEGGVVDEYGNPASPTSSPCGSYGLVPLKSLDYYLAKALGLAQHSEDFRLLPSTFVVDTNKNTHRKEIELFVSESEFNAVTNAHLLEETLHRVSKPFRGILLEIGSSLEGKHYYLECPARKESILCSEIENEVRSLGFRSFELR